MAVEEKEIERFLDVGAIVVLHTEPMRRDGPRHKTVLRGWRKPSHLLLDRPKIDSGMFVSLQESQQCVIRFVHDGLACAFDSVVIDWDNRRSNPYLRITWPQQIQYVQFRKFERVKISFPCSVQTEDGVSYDGEIRDISAGGCGACCPGFDKEDVKNVHLSFTMPDGVTVESVKAEVRSQRRTQEGVFLGVEYLPRQEKALNDIMFFVTSRLDRSKGSDQPAPRVLVIDANMEFATRLRRCFERRNMDVVCAGATLDGLCALRNTPPRALLVSAELSDLPAADVCRLVRNTKSFEDLQIYIYGGDAAQLDAIAKEVGASGYFPPKSTLAPDMAFEVSQILEGKSA